jgi:hypothetical protein
VLSLVFIPFGKFFHVIHRPAVVGVQVFKQVGQADEGVAACRRCGEPLEGAAFVRNLQETMDELDLRYRGCVLRRAGSTSSPAREAILPTRPSTLPSPSLQRRSSRRSSRRLETAGTFGLGPGGPSVLHGCVGRSYKEIGPVRRTKEGT